MKLIVLGSGTCVPSLTRNAPGYYLSAGGLHALIDCGSGTLLQLERTGKQYSDIDVVLITHTHPDHIADLLPLLHVKSAVRDERGNKDITIIGPEGVRDYFENGILSVMSRPDSYMVTVKDARERVQTGNVIVLSGKTVHSRDSVAYRFEEGDSSLVMTGDSDYDEGLVGFARDADVLVADCSFPDSMKVSGHMTPKECGLLAKNAGVKKLVLSHIYPSDIPDKERVTECRATFDGEIILAEDLMELDI